jgi:hypothetical protein
LITTRIHRLALAAAFLMPGASAALAGGDTARTASAHAGAAHTPSWEADIAKPGEPGRPLVIEGRVLGGLDGRQPMRDVVMVLYHAADDGTDHAPGSTEPRMRGTLRTNVMGEYRVRTVLPGVADGGPHLHVQLTAPGTPARGVTLSLARSSAPGSDTTFKRLPWLAELPDWSWAYVHPDSAGTFRCHWDIPYASAYLLAPPDSNRTPR